MIRIGAPPTGANTAIQWDVALGTCFVTWTLFYVAWGLINGHGEQMALWASAATGLATIVAHEVIHYALLPRAARGDVYVWWTTIHPTYHSKGLTRNRSLVVLLAPFVLLSVLPLAVALAGAAVSPWIAAASMVNAIFSGFDLQIAWSDARSKR